MTRRRSTISFDVPRRFLSMPPWSRSHLEVLHSNRRLHHVSAQWSMRVAKRDGVQTTRSGKKLSKNKTDKTALAKRRRASQRHMLNSGGDGGGGGDGSGGKRNTRIGWWGSRLETRVAPRGARPTVTHTRHTLEPSLNPDATRRVIARWVLDPSRRAVRAMGTRASSRFDVSLRHHDTPSATHTVVAKTPGAAHAFSLLGASSRHAVRFCGGGTSSCCSRSATRRS